MTELSELHFKLVIEITLIKPMAKGHCRLSSFFKEFGESILN